MNLRDTRLRGRGRAYVGLASAAETQALDAVLDTNVAALTEGGPPAVAQLPVGQPRYLARLGLA